MRLNIHAADLFGFTYVPCRGCGSQFLRSDQAIEIRPNALFHRWCAWLALTGGRARNVVLVAALFVASACGGSRAWTPADTAWQGAVTVSLGADYLTTRSALDRGWVEENPIMGEGAERISPEVYFATVAVLSAGASASLPGRWRRALQIATLGLQSFIVARNVHRGAGFGISF